MRNLKRALSLGLTAAMISGLMVMGSSAASYADVTSEDNQEAIEVLQAVGIMVGDENGDFNPDQKVTRNEMAVVMCNLMDYTVASYKGTSPFTDVPTWAEPYVAACYTNGITSGISATTYGGSDTVTTGQAALMLEKALGYFQYQADFGSDWLVEATKQGSLAGLFDGVDTGATEALSRNDVAQMVLNALEADMVTAEKNGSDVQIGDIIISGAKATYTARTSNDTKYSKIDNTRVDGKYTIQLGEDLYDGDLVKSGSTSDDFGRPASKWTYNNKEVGTYADDADAVYTAAVAKEDLYDLVGKTVYDDLKSGDASFTVVLDGVDVEKPALSDYIARNNDDDAGKDIIKKGATTEVFIDDDNNVVITVINTYVAQVDGDYDEEDEELDLATLEGAEFDADSMTLSSDDFDYLDTYEDEDYVLVTVADGEIKTIQPAEVITGDVTAYTKEKTVTVDGTKYEYSKNYTKAVASGSDLSYNLNDEYTLVLDTNGYVVYADASDGTNDYVYVASAGQTGGARSSVEADVYFQDGTNKVVTVDNDDESPWSTINGNDQAVNKWFSYDEKSNGKYELTAISDTQRYGVTTSANNDGKILTNGSASVYVNDNVDESKAVARANNATIFIVNDDDNVTVYTGIKNVPDVKVSSGNAYVGVVMDGNYADVVYVGGNDLSVSGDSGDRVYILDPKPDASVDSDDNEYFEYDAIVNGKVTTVKANDNNVFKKDTVGLYQNISYDSDGYVDRAELVTGDKDEDFKAYDGGAVSYSNGVLAIGDEDIVLADNYTIFRNDDGDGKTITPNKFANDFKDSTYTGTVYVYEDDNDEAVEVYVEYKTVNDNDDDTPVITGYDVASTNAGTKSVELTANSVKIANAKIVDSNGNNYNYGSATLTFKVEVRDGGYQNEVTFTAPASTKDTSTYSGCMIDGEFALPYTLTAGNYRVTVTVSNNVIGDLTIGTATLTVD
ncbi:S-layer homology domain-containing protein [Pseudoflavonifractor capillosus]|uniref:S-layer homology domain-containing protein n=1 Tax=Pseudoflavonifractor capillosus TaxID=106588 RepID=UPI0019594911|nr:S-layer homology domain-containing protein [Pseudoflavonifractor capillosus]MBM6681964.1 S-layer homology domain-containing protein [Pseudoflavonifractor capillosus]